MAQAAAHLGAEAGWGAWGSWERVEGASGPAVWVRCRQREGQEVVGAAIREHASVACHYWVYLLAATAALEAEPGAGVGTTGDLSNEACWGVSDEGGEPVDEGPLRLVVGAGDVLPGLEQALMSGLVHCGQQMQARFPAELGYGTSGAKGIPANAALQFAVELMEVNNVPNSMEELDAFVASRAVSVAELVAVESVRKGPIQVTKTYDTRCAQHLAAEFNVVAGLATDFEEQFFCIIDDFPCFDDANVGAAAGANTMLMRKHVQSSCTAAAEPVSTDYLLSRMELRGTTVSDSFLCGRVPSSESGSAEEAKDALWQMLASHGCTDLVVLGEAEPLTAAVDCRTVHFPNWPSAGTPVRREWNQFWTEHIQSIVATTTTTTTTTEPLRVCVLDDGDGSAKAGTFCMLLHLAAELMRRKQEVLQEVVSSQVELNISRALFDALRCRRGVCPSQSVYKWVVARLCELCRTEWPDTSS